MFAKLTDIELFEGMQNVAEPRIGITDAIPESIFLLIAGKKR